MRFAVTAAVVAAAGIAFAIPFTLTDAGDYANPFCADYRCGDAAPAIDALQRGELGRFFDEQPAMGSLSLVARAPAAAIARLAGGGGNAQYQAGAIVCMLAAVAFALLLLRRLYARRASVIAIVAAVAVVLVNPAHGDALQRGHPEEILAAAALAAGALVAGARPLLAGVLVGAAIATKQWALLGLLPVAFMAAEGSRLRVLVAALAVAALFVVPMAVGDPSAFREAEQAALNPPGTVKPLDIWFPWAGREHAVITLPDQSITHAHVWTLPRTADRAAHWMVIALSGAAIAIWWRRGATSALPLLALLLLIRVMLDPRAHPYHLTPFVLAVAAAEVAARARFPWGTMGVAALLALTLKLFDSGDWNTANAVFLAWSIPAAVALAAIAFRRERAPGI
jgi:hypothetical protein